MQPYTAVIALANYYVPAYRDLEGKLNIIDRLYTDASAAQLAVEELAMAMNIPCLSQQLTSSAYTTIRVNGIWYPAELTPTKCLAITECAGVPLGGRFQTALEQAQRLAELTHRACSPLFGILFEQNHPSLQMSPVTT